MAKKIKYKIYIPPFLKQLYVIKFLWNFEFSDSMQEYVPLRFTNSYFTLFKI